MIPELAPGLDISSSGLEAERIRMELAAHNLANANTTKDADGNVYQRRVPVFSSVYNQALENSRGLKGVEVSDVVTDGAPSVKKHMPWHPDADQDGFVKLPDISSMVEMLDIMTATRAYEANLSAIKQSKTMLQGTIDLIKR